MHRTLALLLATIVGSALAQDMDMGCVMKNCGGKFAKAALDSNFRASSKCELGCNDIYDKDVTPEKLDYQNCTTICALTYESEAGDEALACAMDADCVTFPEIPGECPMPEIESTASLASLEGEWWQHRGKNALWDCYPCQHIHSMFMVNDSDWCGQTISPAGGPVQAPCWNYSYSYDLFVKDLDGEVKDYPEGDYKLQYFGQSWQLPGDIPDGNQIDIYYEYMGSYHNETWFILHATDRYVLLVDCSYMMDWIDVGSIVWVRPEIELTDDENAEIRQIYADRLGWEYNDFCYDDHEGTCDGPSTASVLTERVEKAGRREAALKSKLIGALGNTDFWDTLDTVETALVDVASAYGEEATDDDGSCALECTLEAIQQFWQCALACETPACIETKCPAEVIAYDIPCLQTC